MSHATAPLRDACQNCGTKLDGPFCHRCGQKDFDFHQSFGHVVHEALETWFHIDGSFLRGFYTLLFQPGRMTRDFNEGRRARHVPPFRFYLVISVVFFLLIRPAAVPPPEQTAPPAAGEVRETGQGTRVRYFAPGRDFQVDEKDKPAPGTMARAMVDRAERFASDPDQLVQAFYAKLPKMLLLCLPIFAWFTRLLYRRGPWSYLQHLILSVHLHTFVFLWTMVVAGWTGLVGLGFPFMAELLGLAAFLYGIFYYYAALRHALGTSWRSALLQGSLAGVAYGCTLALGFAVTGTLALFLT